MRTLLYSLKTAILICLYKRSEALVMNKAIVEGVVDGLKGRLGKNKKYLPL